jgi:hypothetical protein
MPGWVLLGAVGEGWDAWSALGCCVFLLRGGGAWCLGVVAWCLVVWWGWLGMLDEREKSWVVLELAVVLPVKGGAVAGG